MLLCWWVRLNQRLREMVRRREQEGQGLVEYSLIISFVAIVVFFSLKFLQPQISNTLNMVANSL